MNNTRSAASSPTARLLAGAFFANLYFERALWIVYLLRHGYGLRSILALQVLINLVMLVAQVPTGMFADKAGRKVAIAIGRVGSVVFLILLMLASSFGLLVVAFVIYGIAVTMISGAEDALLFNSADENADFTRVRGMYASVLTGAPMLALAVGGLLQEVSWHLLFFSSIAAQAVSLVILGFLKVQPPQRDAAERAQSLFQDLKDVMRTSATVRTLIAGLAIANGAVSAFAIIAQALFAQEGAGTVEISLLYAAESAAATVAAMAAYRLERRVGQRGALIGSAVGHVAMFVLAFTGGLPATATAFVALGGLDNISDPVGNAELNRVTKEQWRASVLSVYGMCSLAVMVTALLITAEVPLSVASSKHVIAGVGMAACLIALACLAMIRPAAPLAVPGRGDIVPGRGDIVPGGQERVSSGGRA